MNKVWLATMHPVVVALMAKSKPIVNHMAQVGPLVDWGDVMRLKFTVASAVLAGVIVSFQYGSFPSQIIRATPALIVFFTLAFGYALAIPRTINMFAGFVAGVVNKGFAASVASVLDSILSALLRAINFAPNVGGRTLQRLTAGCALYGHLLRLSLAAARMGAKTLLGVFVPIPVVLFRDDLAADFAGLESFRVRLDLLARYTSVGAFS